MVNGDEDEGYSFLGLAEYIACLIVLLVRYDGLNNGVAVIMASCSDVIIYSCTVFLSIWLVWMVWGYDDHYLAYHCCWCSTAAVKIACSVMIVLYLAVVVYCPDVLHTIWRIHMLNECVNMGKKYRVSSYFWSRSY